jgi:hypothetical protein
MAQSVSGTSNYTGRCNAGERRLQSAAFLSVWLFIAFVSVHDAYLMAVTRVAHRDGGVEQNPVAERLIALAGGRIWLLLGIKACGTVAACALMLILYERCKRVAWIATLATAALQALLLLYLLTR